MLWSLNLEGLLLTPRATNAEKHQSTSAFKKFWVGSIWNYEYLPLNLNGNTNITCKIKMGDHSEAAHLARRSAYFSFFLRAAASIPDSNGLVSSMRVMDWSLQTTMSGLLSVVATSCGKE